MAGELGSRGPVDKDNFSRGGSKRWTGKGPAPARHIPWPEIFKHHLSVIEGHYKMLDMIRKHTVEGTANHRTIVACLDRAKLALDDTKLANRNFVPPQDQRDSVPVGSSSVSMYPGYSPADHTYGEAAQEYGKAWAETNKAGKNAPPGSNGVGGPEYQVGQASAAKRKAFQGGASQGDKLMNYESILPHRKNAATTEAKAEAADTNGQNTKPIFVFDSEPAPVDVNGGDKERGKDESSSGKELNGDAVEPSKSKKAKTKHDDTAGAAEEVEKEDITARVDARLKEKEEKRKGKEKKRKRESIGSNEEAPPEPEKPLTESEEKPKKKKSKKSRDEEEGNVKSKRSAADAEGEKPKKKKKKDSKSS